MSSISDTRVLSIRRLSRRFGDREVIRSLDLTARRGERIGLHGPNGSGKTTMLRCIAGTLTPTSGEIDVAGVAAGTLQARRLVGASISQERSFYQRLSGNANLLFFARLRHSGKRAAALQVLELSEELEISDIVSRRLDTCSTGMLQQLSFARALLGDPALVLLDEPTRSLDTEAIRRLWAGLDRRPHLTVLMATHRDDDLERCHSRLRLPI